MHDRPHYYEYSIEEIRRRLSYDSETGVIWWASGQVAGFIIAKGYISIGLAKRVRVLSHRLAWALHYGEWPSGQIDHIDGNKQNNAISNLRIVTNSQNKMNTGLYRNNSSGAKGVSWCHGTKKWHARITKDGKVTSLGRFADLEAARRAYEAAAELLHGDYRPGAA